MSSTSNGLANSASMVTKTMKTPARNVVAMRASSASPRRRSDSAAAIPNPPSRVDHHSSDPSIPPHNPATR